jgi:hypothetical protein
MGLNARQMIERTTRFVKQRVLGRKPLTAQPEELERSRARRANRRVFLGGPFSPVTGVQPPYWVGEVLGRKKMTIISGGRLGTTKDVIETGLDIGAKNISVVVEGLEAIGPNIKGKARRIVAKETKNGARPLHTRLGLLQNHRVKAYLFLYQGEAQYSGTQLELQAIINAQVLEPITKQKWPRPILLIGPEWKETRQKILKDYAKRGMHLNDLIRIVENPKQLEQALQ